MSDHGIGDFSNMKWYNKLILVVVLIPLTIICAPFYILRKLYRKIRA